MRESHYLRSFLTINQHLKPKRLKIRRIHTSIPYSIKVRKPSESERRRRRGAYKWRSEDTVRSRSGERSADLAYETWSPSSCEWDSSELRSARRPDSSASFWRENPKSEEEVGRNRSPLTLPSQSALMNRLLLRQSQFQSKKMIFFLLWNLWRNWFKAKGRVK